MGSYQILSFDVAHLLDNAPQPTFELEQFITTLARLIVKCCIRNERSDVNVTDTVQ